MFFIVNFTISLFIYRNEWISLLSMVCMLNRTKEKHFTMLLGECVGAQRNKNIFTYHRLDWIKNFLWMIINIAIWYFSFSPTACNMSLLLTITVLLIFIVVVKFGLPFWRRYSQLKKDYQNISLLPVSSIPFIGNILQYDKEPYLLFQLILRQIKECQDQNKGAFCFWTGFWPMIFLCSGDGLEVFENFIISFLINLIFSDKHRRLSTTVNNWSNLLIIHSSNLGLKLVCSPGKFSPINLTNLFSVW